MLALTKAWSNNLSIFNMRYNEHARAQNTYTFNNHHLRYSIQAVLTALLDEKRKLELRVTELETFLEQAYADVRTAEAKATVCKAALERTNAKERENAGTVDADKIIHTNAGTESSGAIAIAKQAGEGDRLIKVAEAISAEDQNSDCFSDAYSTVVVLRSLISTPR